MAREDEKIYRVSVEAGDMFDKFRSELIRSGVLDENSSNKDFMEYLSLHLSDIGQKNNSSVEDQKIEASKNSSVLISDQKIEHDIFERLNEVDDSVHHIELMVEEFISSYFRRGIYMPGGEQPGKFLVENSSGLFPWSSSESSQPSFPTIDDSYDDEEMPKAIYPYEKWIPDFTPEEVEYLKKVESDDWNKGYYVTRDAKGRLKLTDGDFYDENDFPHSSSGVAYVRTPFGFYPQLWCETQWHLINPGRFPHRFFKERNRKFQKWYGRDPHSYWENVIDPSYDYDKDPTNFVVKDVIKFIEDHNLYFWQCTVKGQGATYEQV